MIKLLTKKEKNKQIFYNTKEGKMQNFLSEDCLFLDDKEKIYKRKMSPEQRRNINTVTFSRKYIITNKELTVFIDQYNKTESNINATCLWKNSSKCENVRENSSLKNISNKVLLYIGIGVLLAIGGFFAYSNMNSHSWGDYIYYETGGSSRNPMVHSTMSCKYIKNSIIPEKVDGKPHVSNIGFCSKCCTEELVKMATEEN